MDHLRHTQNNAQLNKYHKRNVKDRLLNTFYTSIFIIIIIIYTTNTHIHHVVCYNKILHTKKKETLVHIDSFFFINIWPKIRKYSYLHSYILKC